MSSSRGNFAQGLASRAVDWSANVGSQVWGMRVFGTGLDAGKYEDIQLDIAIRETTTKDALLYGKGNIEGGWKLTVPAHFATQASSIGTLGDITEETVFVRGTGWSVATRPHVVEAKEFKTIHVHRVQNSGVVQEYWVFVKPIDEGPSSG